jgi:hypothetical protein
VRRLALVTIATILTAAACSDSGASGPTTTATPPPTDASTTVPVTTPTTTSTSAAPTTITAPPPSTTTLDNVKKAVIAGYEKGYEAYNAALADPANFNPDTIHATYAGSAADTVIKRLEDFKTAGWRTRPGPQGLQYYIVEDATLGNGPPVTEASLTVCDVSDTIVYDPRDPNNPNDDAIVNSLLETYRWRWTMILDGTSWKRAKSEQLDYETGVNGCPTKPAS